MINGKQSLNNSDVSDAFVNYKVRRKDKQSTSSSTKAKAITAREMSSNYLKGKGELKKSKSGGREDLKKNQCALCREEGHLKIDYTKIKLKKRESKSEANIV